MKTKEKIIQNILLSFVSLFNFLVPSNFCYWPSTRDDIQCPPMQEDPYESSILKVGPSKMEGGGEGLYARKDIPAGTLAGYYNGIRLKADEEFPIEDTGYAIFVEWNSLYGCKNGEHMDLPPKVRYLLTVIDRWL